MITTALSVFLVVTAAVAGHARIEAAARRVAQRLVALLGWLLLAVIAASAGLCACIVPGVAGRR